MKNQQTPSELKDHQYYLKLFYDIVPDSIPTPLFNIISCLVTQRYDAAYNSIPKDISTLDQDMQAVYSKIKDYFNAERPKQYKATKSTDSTYKHIFTALDYNKYSRIAKYIHAQLTQPDSPETLAMLELFKIETTGKFEAVERFVNDLIESSPETIRNTLT